MTLRASHRDATELMLIQVLRTAYSTDKKTFPKIGKRRYKYSPMVARWLARRRSPTHKRSQARDMVSERDLPLAALIYVGVMVSFPTPPLAEILFLSALRADF